MQWVYRNAARDGDVAVLKRQLELGCAVDTMDVEGNTALMLAADKGHAVVLEAIVALKLECPRPHPAATRAH